MKVPGAVPRPETDARGSSCAECGNPATGREREYWVRTGRQGHGTVRTASDENTFADGNRTLVDAADGTTT
jgi:hypothetical protein